MRCDIAALQLAGRQRCIDIRIRVEIYDFDALEPDLLEIVLLGCNVPLAISQPRLDTHLYGPALRRSRNILRQGHASRGAHHERSSAGPDDIPTIWCPDHVQLSLVSNATNTTLFIKQHLGPFF